MSSLHTFHRLAMVFMRNSEMREKFNFYFSAFFCWYQQNFLFFFFFGGGGEGDWGLHYNSYNYIEFGIFPGLS